LVAEPDPAARAAPFTGKAAYVISQSYYYVAAVVGIGLLLGGVIAALIGLREWIFPVMPEAHASPFLEGSDDAIRSILGGLAFAIPGGLTFWWHLREARRREPIAVAGMFWGSALYFHLVAFVALVIALGGAIETLHALIDVAVPQCFGPEQGYVLDPSTIPGAESGTDPGTVGAIEPIRQCYPSTSEALRNALDGLIVAGVAGATWIWHLRRGRRLSASPGVEPDEASPAEAAPA
jgi:uncharacterized protein DUF5671